MINKELLSEIEKKRIKEFVIEKNELRYIIENDTNNIPDLYFINIYELAHKCKEWADKLNIGIQSYIWFGTGVARTYAMSGRFDLYSEHFASTEQEAIFKATQWVYDNIKQ